MTIPTPQEALASLEKNGNASDEEGELPAITTFYIDETDARGNRYEGTFVYTVPRLGEQIKIGQAKNVYLPAGTPDGRVLTLVDMLCYLAVTCSAPQGQELPAWFNTATQLYDSIALSALYERCLDYEARFLGGDQKRRGDAEGHRGEDEHGGGDPPHVGRKVQPPAQRRETLAGDGARGA